MDSDYVDLLERLYKYQCGNVGDHKFPITRGVRQGDILSPLLFNAVLEHAMRKWKRKLRSHGFQLHPDNEEERLTNVRYVDEILLLGKAITEVTSMLGILVDVLKEYGLELNVQKTNLFSTDIAKDVPCYCDRTCGMIEQVLEYQKHKYLGRMFSGEVRHRGRMAVENRISCGWTKYHALQHVFEDKHIPIKLRLELSDAAISSTVLYSLETCPLGEKLFHRSDVVQRKMLRRIIAWISFSEERWDERSHKMKRRFERCMGIYPVSEWSEAIHVRKSVFVAKIDDELPFLTYSALKWDPVACSSANFCTAYRLRGRPLTRW